MEELEQLKKLVEKWQNEIIDTLQKGESIVIKMNKDNVVLYQNIIKIIRRTLKSPLFFLKKY